jgi:hypothetical protein
MFLALSAASAVLFWKSALDESVGAMTSIACIGVYLIAFASGAGAIPWFLAGELVPVKVRVSSLVNMAPNIFSELPGSIYCRNKTWRVCLKHPVL